MKEQPDNLERALEAAGMGYTPISVLPGTKIPAVKWKPWQDIVPPDELIRQWFSVRRNIAIVTRDMVVFDCDDPEKAELVLAECGDTPHKLRTPRGGLHLGYRRRKGSVLSNQVKVKGMPIDIRTDGGLEMIPESETEDGRYEWLGEGLKPKSELPVACIGWTRTRVRRTVKPVEIDGERGMLMHRARAYLACVEGAVSGQRGHDQTFRVACVLVQKFGLSEEEAWPLLKEWSELTCEPPWSDRELAHKLSDAIKKRGVR